MSVEDRITLQISLPFWTAYRATLQLLLRMPLQILGAAVFPAAGIYLIYLWKVNHSPIGIAEIALVLGCFLFEPLIIGLLLFLGRRRNPLSKGPFTYTFDSDGVQTSGAAFEMKLKWSAIRKVRESGAFIFFFTSAMQAQCIPLAQVRAAGRLGELRGMVARHVANVSVGKTVHSSGG